MVWVLSATHLPGYLTGNRVTGIETGTLVLFRIAIDYCLFLCCINAYIQYSFIHSSVCESICPFILVSLHACIYSFFCPSIHQFFPFIFSFVHPFTHQSILQFGLV